MYIISKTMFYFS